MFGLTDLVGRATVRAASIAAVCVLSLSVGTLAAKAETRTLKFYNLHTKEKISIAYKSNGRFSSDALKKINWFLRDWRRSEPTTMDPRLLDLIWEAYRQSGSRDYINVVCGYRAPATNNMLRSRSAGVAKESQHTRGKALDFFIPDVPLKKMREIGLKMQVGGVGYYPRSGSPFVHFDVGNARHWPRMTRKELVAVFPNGNTVHVPSDGKPLPGYEQALASYKARRSASDIEVANAGVGAGRTGGGGGKTLFAALFGGGGADEEDDVSDVETTSTAVAPAPAVKKPERAAPRPQADVAVAAMLPTAKPNLLATGVPLPLRDTYDTSAPIPPAGIAETAPKQIDVASLDLSRIPLPSAAPGRQVPAVPTEAATDNVSALVAALEETPARPETAVGAPAQLAYSVPTPRDRPPFESILKGEPKSLEPADAMMTTEVAALMSTPAESPVAAIPVPAPAMEKVAEAAAPVDAVKRIVEASTAMRADMSAPPKTATTAERPAPVKSRAPVRNNLLLAALEEPKARPQRPATAAKIDVPSGKTGRFARVTAAQAEAPVRFHSQQVIDSRIEMAALVTDPGQRAAMAVTKKPNPDVLVREMPTSVFTAGFAPNPMGKMSNRFVGSAVNFLPVAKFQ